MADDDRFDIAIVGASTAGCVLARRLSEDTVDRPDHVVEEK